MEQLGEPRRSVILAEPGFVYASADALYMATDGIMPNGYGARYSKPAQELSAVHKFALQSASVQYRGSAPIRGHVLNQFSMDEHEGVLRVASTSGYAPDPAAHSTVTTLHESGGQLTRLGELTGLAPSEDIRSVRFDGERGFVVTFKKTDPLFAIDLSQPSQPAVLGELKIPGFSTHLHPLGSSHLLALGFEAIDQGSFAYFDGLQLQMFDIAELMHAGANAWYGSPDCQQWWSESTSAVKRTLFFEDYLVGLSHDELRAAHVDSLTTPLVQLPLTTDGHVDPQPLPPYR